MSRIGKSIETENRFVVIKAWGKAERGTAAKEEGVSLPISIPLCWLAQLCRVCARQALAAHAPSAGPSSRSTQGFPSTWFQWVSNFSNT